MITLQYIQLQHDKSLALSIFPQLHQSIDEEWRRSSGAMTCKYCGLLYRQHPVEEIYNIDHRLCDGTIVHL